MSGISDFLIPYVGIIGRAPGQTIEESICRAACSTVVELNDLANQIAAGQGDNARAWQGVIDLCYKNRNKTFNPVIRTFAACQNEADYKALCDDIPIMQPIILDRNHAFKWMPDRTWAYQSVLYWPAGNIIPLGSLDESSEMLSDALLQIGVVDIAAGAANVDDALAAFTQSAISNRPDFNWTAYNANTAWAVSLAPETPGLPKGERLVRQAACHIMDTVDTLMIGGLYTHILQAPGSVVNDIITGLQAGVFLHGGVGTRLTPTQWAVLITSQLSGLMGVAKSSTTARNLGYGRVVLEGVNQAMKEVNVIGLVNAPWTQTSRDRIGIICPDLPPLTDALLNALLDPATSTGAWRHVEPYLTIGSKQLWTGVPVDKRATFMMWLCGLVSGTAAGQRGNAAIEPMDELVKGLLGTAEAYVIQIIGSCQLPSLNGPNDITFSEGMRQISESTGGQAKFMGRPLLEELSKTIMVPTVVLHNRLMGLRQKFLIKYATIPYIYFKLDKSRLVNPATHVALLRGAMEDNIWKCIMQEYYQSEYRVVMKLLAINTPEQYSLTGMFSGLEHPDRLTTSKFMHVLILSRMYMVMKGSFINYRIDEAKVATLFTAQDLGQWKMLINALVQPSVLPMLRQVEAIRNYAPGMYKDAVDSSDPLREFMSVQAGILTGMEEEERRKAAREFDDRVRDAVTEIARGRERRRPGPVFNIYTGTQ